LNKCLAIATEKGNIQNYLARTADGEIIAFYCLLADEKFVYSLLGGSTPKGKEMAAFYLLTDAAIRDHAGPSPTPRIFRFEGSDIPGIAFFNAQFGADLTHYPYLVSNRLPWPLKWAKPSRHRPLTR
jgi:hypothetical protein